MNVQEKAIMKSILTKLSALRVTLDDDEQEVLDQLILGSPAEVEAHRFVRSSPDEARLEGPDEVAAHQMRVVNRSVTFEGDEGEVMAHAMPEAAFKSSRFVKNKWIEISINPETKFYQV